MKNPRDWLSSHWYPRPGWTESTRYLTWHLIPDDGAELRVAAVEYERTLSGLPGLDIVPRQWLHLTVQGVGFALGRLGIEAIAARFSTVSLLELRREGHLYCWDLVADVPFAARTITDSGAHCRGG